MDAEAQLRSFVMPQVTFCQSALRDAFEFLRWQAGVLHAAAGSAGGSPGAALFLLLPDGDARLSLRISMELREVSVFEALCSLAALAGLQLRTPQDGVFLCSPHVGRALDASASEEWEEARVLTCTAPWLPLPDELRRAIAERYPAVAVMGGVASLAFCHAVNQKANFHEGFSQIGGLRTGIHPFG